MYFLLSYEKIEYSPVFFALKRTLLPAAAPQAYEPKDGPAAGLLRHPTDAELVAGLNRFIPFEPDLRHFLTFHTIVEFVC